ncbi:MAG: hypothetical protein WD270_02415 [Acetobacterales bacterium]
MGSAGNTARRTAERVQEKHNHYTIIAGFQEGDYRAIAYAGRRKVKEVHAASLQEAIGSLKRFLDERSEQMRANRVDGVPNVVEYREAIFALERAGFADAVSVLHLHGSQPDGTATLSALSRKAELTEDVVAAAYARFGRKLGTVLGFSPKADTGSSSFPEIATFALPAPSSSGVRQTVTVRAKVRKAIGDSPDNDDVAASS